MNPHQPELLPQPITSISPADQAKHEEYLRRLAEYLKDPLFRAIEGFPIGSDEDILALSDPPYYTACPNPFLPEIIAGWQQEREEIRKKLGLRDESYQREPFAADVSEGKNDPIYNAHSYHTKVPHKAIMRYILHYTDPGDIVFDGFCGTGMTGVAAQLCGDKKAVEELGYRVDEKGVIYDNGKPISILGVRRSILNDLSPSASSIAFNYNKPISSCDYDNAAKEVLYDLDKECGWMYETWHPSVDHPQKKQGRINFTVWSDIFVCPNCGLEMIFRDVGICKEEILDEWNCPQCKTLLTKRPRKSSNAIKVNPSIETIFDQRLGKVIERIKQKPVIINYKFGNQNFEKIPDNFDLEIIERIENSSIPYGFPVIPMLFKGQQWGDSWRAGVHAGISHVHHFFTKRSLWNLAKIFDLIRVYPNYFQHWLLFTFDQAVMGMSKWARYVPSHYSQVNQGLSGTLYVGSQVVEVSPRYILDKKISRLTKILATLLKETYSFVTTQSATSISLPDKSIDYVFVDPPFGSNLMYSELNFITEAWLKVFTNYLPEAIINESQRKNLFVYQSIMETCFSEFYRVLKPGGWITVEFHNSQNSVWNSIQEALLRGGCVIADVRTLDKQGMSFKQIVSTSAVKQDLIISAYKPNGYLEEKFALKAGSEEGAWEFMHYHLGKLPVTNNANGIAAVNVERQAFLLFDRMIAFHIQRGVMVPLSAPEFYAGLEQRFIRRDGMYFLPDQVAEYDRALLDSGKPIQLPLLVTDEKTAITWLRLQLDPASGGEPQTRGDLTNQFNQTMHRARHEKALELIEILEQNFLQDEAGRWYVPDHNRASDKERVRLRALLKEFNEYAVSAGRLRQFRTEAVRAGFADCFKRQDYDTLIKIAERLPEDVLREDPDLLMYYDSALLRKK